LHPETFSHSFVVGPRRTLCLDLYPELFPRLAGAIVEMLESSQVHSPSRFTRLLLMLILTLILTSTTHTHPHTYIHHSCPLTYHSHSHSHHSHSHHSHCKARVVPRLFRPPLPPSSFTPPTPASLRSNARNG
jgi:hypothetical protein